MTNRIADKFDIQNCIETACLLEATARKPGNVHPAASFADLNYSDFVRSAEIVAPILADAGRLGVGRSIRHAAEETRREVGRNTNLGILLLIAPLAAGPAVATLADGIATVLDSLDETDASDVYESIRIAHPAGMGTVDDQDIANPPSLDLVDCMKLAADRDSIAQQYTNGFSLILDSANRLAAEDFEERWEESVIQLQLSLLSKTPDTLIARKCGIDIAQDVSSRATDVLNQLPEKFDARHPALLNFDCYLRLDGHRLNPGTTADLVAACLFAALRERTIEWTGRIDLARVASEFANTADINTETNDPT